MDTYTMGNMILWRN